MPSTTQTSNRAALTVSVSSSILLLPYARWPQGVFLTLALLGLVQLAWLVALRRRRGLARLLLLSLSATLALTLGEALAAWRWPITPYRIVPTEECVAEDLYLDDPALGRVLAPNFSGRFLHPEYAAELFETNSDGFRDEEWPTSVVPGDARVLLLGDSTCVGFGVSGSQTIAARLEEQLSARLPKVRVFNAAVASYGPRHERILLERFGERLQPTHVVVVFYDGNDLQNCRAQFVVERKSGLHDLRLASEGPGPDPLPVAGRAPSLLSRWYWARRSALYNRLETACMPWLTENGIFKHHAYRGMLLSSRKEPEGSVQEELDLARQAILGMSQQCERLGAELLFVRMPMRLQTEVASFEQIAGVYGEDSAALDRDLPGRTLLEFCRDQGIRALDLLPVFEIPGRGPNSHYFVEGHPNAQGNRVAAEQIARAL